ncbi:MAG: sugar transferase [Planctomycetaceae bacterium]
MHMLYRKFGKRLLDILVSLAALILLAPVLAVTSLLVRVKLGSPVLFIQQRPGRDGRSFRLLKFRTMIDACGRMDSRCRMICE